MGSLVSLSQSDSHSETCVKVATLRRPEVCVTVSVMKRELDEEAGAPGLAPGRSLMASVTLSEKGNSSAHELRGSLNDFGYYLETT